MGRGERLDFASGQDPCRGLPGRGRGFAFPGCRFEAKMRRVRQKGMARLKDRTGERPRRGSGVSPGVTAKAPNPVPGGWSGCFRHGIADRFPDVDGFVRRRLRAIPRQQAGMPGSGTPVADGRRRPDGFFTTAGLSAMTAARSKSPFPDAEATSRRAACGKTARPVRREARRKPSLPLWASARILCPAAPSPPPRNGASRASSPSRDQLLRSVPAWRCGL